MASPKWWKIFAKLFTLSFPIPKIVLLYSFAHLVNQDKFRLGKKVEEFSRTRHNFQTAAKANQRRASKLVGERSRRNPFKNRAKNPTSLAQILAGITRVEQKRMLSSFRIAICILVEKRKFLQKMTTLLQKSYMWHP